MIVGLGIDVVEISRFSHFYRRAPALLQRMYDHTEIAYCMRSASPAAQRFAVRWAAKEALCKALNGAGYAIPLRTVLRASLVAHDALGVPQFQINWNMLEIEPHGLTIHLSMTHTREYAQAVVILEKG